MRDAYTRLGVSPDADARDVRKAYARELKKIDQETDPEGFQTLREAYEWALSQANRTPSDPISVPAPPTAPTHEEQAHAAWTQALKLKESADSTDDQAWHRALQEALASDLLINLEARTWFEAHVVHTLCAGWRPGHEDLLLAAIDIFHWNHNPRRLTAFGQAGISLMRALEEKRLLAGLPLAESAALNAALARLRAPRPPNMDEPLQYKDALMRLEKIFPNLIAISVDADTFRHWRKARLTAPMFEEPEEKPPEYTGKTLFWLLAITIIAAILISILFGDSGHPRSNPPKPDIPVSTAQLLEIGSRISYRAKPAQRDIITVEYEVFLDIDRRYLGMNMKHRSGDPEFDQAVAKAIRETPAFPPDTVSVYRARYSLLPRGAQSAHAIELLPPGSVVLPVVKKN